MKIISNPKKTFFSTLEVFAYKYRLVALIIFTAALVLLPKLITSQYFITITIKISVYICLAMGLNILTGYTGLVSLGHAGFVAIGAYTSSLLMVKSNMNFFPAAVIGCFLAGLIGILLGLPTLRVSGTYLSIITLGFGEIIKMISMNWNVVTNGTLGVKNIPKPSLFGLKLTVSNHGMYYIAILLVIFVTIFCSLLIRSHTGRALQAIRADELAATMMGINVTRYKILAFSISAAICALGGSLYSSLIGYIDPNTFNFDVSILILSIVILGGLGTLRGMFVGSVILIAFPEVSRFLMAYRFVLYGIILVLMMRFKPQGIMGWKSTLPYKLSKNVKNQLDSFVSKE